MLSGRRAIVALMSSAAATNRIRYELRDRVGDVPAVHVRIEAADGSKRFLWEQVDGTPGLEGRPVASLPLYGVWRLADMRADNPVYLTEGEKAADTLVAIGLLAVATVTGASSIPDDEVLGVLAGREVRLWADNDRIGRDHMSRIYDALVDLGAAPSLVGWPDAPDHGDAADFIESGHSAADVMALPILSAPLGAEGWAESIQGTSTRHGIHSAQGSILFGAGRILNFQTAREFAESTSPDVEWIARPWVACGAITGVDGKIKVAGKTTWALHLCRAAVDGLPFIGEPTRRTGVVYLTEQPPASLRVSLRRADLLGRDDFTLLTWRDGAGTAWPDVVAAAVDQCEARSAGLLVIDTLSRFAGIDGDGENDAGKADAAMAPLQLAAADGLAVIVLRHERKAGGDVGDSGRGSTAFGGATDIILAIRRSEAGPNVRRIYALSRFDETPDILSIELTESGYISLGTESAVVLRETEGKLRRLLPAAAEQALSMEQLGQKIGASRQTIQRGLDALVAAGQAAHSGSGRKGDPYRWWASLGTLRESLEPGLPQGRLMPWQLFVDPDEPVVGTA
jgi:hypothetical protein